MSPARVFEFSTNTLPANQQFEGWYSLMTERGTALTLDRPGLSGREPFQGRVKTGVCGELSLSHIDCGINRVIRTQRHVQRDTELHFILYLCLDNQLTLSRGGEIYRMPVGTLALVNTEYSLIAQQESRNVVSVRIPHSNLPDIPRDSPVTPIMWGRLGLQLQSMVLQISHQLFHLREINHQLVTELTGQLNGIFAHTPTTSKMKEYHFAEACKEIQQHRTGDLTIDELGQTLGVSTNYLFKVMAYKGTTFRELIRLARLQSAIRHMANVNCHLPLYQLALFAGYHTPSQFSRAFSLQFGLTPSQVRKALSPDAAMAISAPEKC